jgi:FAD/FMN-containing dehydrogenase
VAPTRYTAVQSIVEAFNPSGLRNYWKTSYLRDLPEEAIDTLIERYARVPSPWTHVVLYTLGGAVARVPGDRTAVAYRDARHALVLIGMWDGAGADETNLHWLREAAEAVQPFTSGGFYINYEADTAVERVSAAYGAEKYARLVRLKQQWDPANLFRLNQNIVPAKPL